MQDDNNDGLGGNGSPSRQILEDIAKVVIELDVFCRINGLDDVAAPLDGALDAIDQRLTGSKPVT